MSHPPFLINIQGSSCFLRPRPDSPEAPEGPGTSSRSVPSSKMCAFQIVYSATIFTLTFNSLIFHHIHIYIYPKFSTLTFSKSYPTYLLSLSNNTSCPTKFTFTFSDHIHRQSPPSHISLLNVYQLSLYSVHVNMSPYMKRNMDMFSGRIRYCSASFKLKRSSMQKNSAINGMSCFWKIFCKAFCSI